MISWLRKFGMHTIFSGKVCTIICDEDESSRLHIQSAHSEKSGWSSVGMLVTLLPFAFKPHFEEIQDQLGLFLLFECFAGTKVAFRLVQCKVILLVGLG